MFQKLKNKMKDQRGLTLIELLAVIVILAIISAIAIPSILGLIDNSKKDAHVANAQQMINSAKLALAGDSSVQPAKNTSVFVPLKYLEDKGYLEPIKDPEGGTTYTSQVTSPTSTIKTVATDVTGSYVEIHADNAGKISYKVYLDGSEKSIGSQSGAISESALKRSVVSP